MAKFRAVDQDVEVTIASDRFSFKQGDTVELEGRLASDLRAGAVHHRLVEEVDEDGNVVENELAETFEDTPAEPKSEDVTEPDEVEVERNPVYNAEGFEV
jgi:hypothetical protein